MEDMRIFERKCLRLCAGIHRTPESDYAKYVSNKELYDTLNVNRIDNHIISLIRKHWQRASRNFNNSLIYGPVLSYDDSYIQFCMTNGNIPPAAFVYMDKSGYIQDITGIPIIYHIKRQIPRKCILYQPILNAVTADPNTFSYEMSIPQVDVPNRNVGLWKTCWWLNDVT